MYQHARVERYLAQSIRGASGREGPPLLAAAMRYAVIPGGARIRPRLALAVSQACGEDAPSLSTAVAASIELLHCASLVHDDLPCFDAAQTRRGRASVHVAYGERIAVLTGDALIVLAFQNLAAFAPQWPTRVGPLLSLVAHSVGPSNGIIGGQAWECEPSVTLGKYQRAKTGALFAAATAAGACAAGHEPLAWHALGERIGEAYQIADDIGDVVASEAQLGKPVGRDDALGRPNAVHHFGLAGAIARFENLIAVAIDTIPECPGAGELQSLMLAEGARLLPRELARPAA